MDLDNAVKAHGEWKLKFRMAISRKESMDAASICRDDACPLGAWLHGEARAKYSKLKSYQACVEKHAHFHKEAGQVAQAINSREYDRASAMLEGAAPYVAASNAATTAIMALRKEAGL